MDKRKCTQVWTLLSLIKKTMIQLSVMSENCLISTNNLPGMNCDFLSPCPTRGSCKIPPFLALPLAPNMTTWPMCSSLITFSFQTYNNYVHSANYKVSSTVTQPDHPFLYIQLSL